MVDAHESSGLNLHDLADTVLRAEYWQAVEEIAKAIEQDGGADASLQSIKDQAFKRAKASGWPDNDDRAVQCLRYSSNRVRVQRLSSTAGLGELAAILMGEDVLDACKRRGLL